MVNQNQATPTADEIRRVFEADYVEILVRPDGTIAVQRDDEPEEELVTRSLKRGRTWYSGALDA
jgi:hypothetical protein